MAWTQGHRHIQLGCDHPDIATSIVSKAALVESLLGADLPSSVWDDDTLMPTPLAYPSPYHLDQRAQPYQARQQALYCGYRYSITLVHERAGLNIAEWIGQGLTLYWHTGDHAQPQQTRHGIITEVAALGSNGGMATYRIICEPALHQLRLSSHNRRHHHLSLADLVTEITAPFDLNIDMDDRLKDCHIQHSVQYNQTDLAYLQQHLARFGITGYYHHEQDNHTLRLLPHDAEILRPSSADIHSILSQNPASLADRQDRIITLTPSTRHHLSEAQLYRYDNRLRGHHSGAHQSDQSPAHPSTHHRFMHSHTHMDDASLTALATRYQQYQEQVAHQGVMTGNIRHLKLPHAYLVEGNPFVTEPISLVAIYHQINNHLPIDWLGKTPIDPITLQPSATNSKVNMDKQADQVHHVSALYQPYPYHHHIPFGSDLAQTGAAHPSLTGLMSASIVANDSSRITTDRNHRAHIRYHWQHGNDASGADNEHWVPIASHLVADHMGQTHPLRHGQHVLIDFIGGDLTHPIIIGSTHNGQGNPDAQHNSIVSDSDAIDATSPTWFKGSTHAHPIDGIKTQSIDSSRTGEATKDSAANGYNQLLFDHYPSREQISLYSSSHQSSLNLGHLHQHTDHVRGLARGRGISIETQAAGSVQGSTGMHISSHSPASHHMSHGSHSKLQTADQHQSAYQTLMSTHQPVGLQGSSSTVAEDGQTPYALFSKDTADTAIDGAGAWQQRHILIDSQHDMGIMTGQHSQHNSTQNTHSHATAHTHHHSQTQINQLVAGDIHYYANKAQIHTAAHGDMTIQAHQSEMRLDSEQILRIHSRSSIDIIAPDTLTLKAAGSGIEISGGNVTFITSSQVGYKASKVDWGSGGGSGSPNVFLPRAKLPENLDFYLRYIVKNQDDEPLPFTKCLLIKPDGSTEVCTTDYEGKLKLIVDDESKYYALHVITNEVDEAIEPDENDTEVGE